MLSHRDLNVSNHELTQKGNQRERWRVDAIVHRDHGCKPDGDAKSAEAEQPPIELAGAPTARNLIVRPTLQVIITYSVTHGESLIGAFVELSSRDGNRRGSASAFSSSTSELLLQQVRVSA